MHNYPFTKGRHWFVYLLCFTLIILDSCVTNDERQTAVGGAQQWFDKNLGTQWDAWPKKHAVRSIDWENAVTNGSTLEVPVQLEQKVSGQYYNGKASGKNEIALRLVIWKENDDYHAIALEILHLGGNMPRHLNDVKDSRFTGLIIAHLGGEKMYSAVVENGGPQQKKDFTDTQGKVQDINCYYYVSETTVSIPSMPHIPPYTSTQTTFLGCYDDTAPQGLPPDIGGGGGPYFDIPSGGGSGGVFTPELPENPTNGATREIIDSDGKSIIYQFDSESNTWKILLITLPAAVVNSKPNEYPELANKPTDLPVLSPDNKFIWEFDISSLSWKAEPLSVCPNNFRFVSVTTNNLWQESAISGAYVKILVVGNNTPMIRVNLPTVYFGVPYYNVDGNLVYTSVQAAFISTNAFNEAEIDLVNYYRNNPYFAEAHYQSYWLTQMQSYMSIYSIGRGTVSFTGSINTTTPVIPIAFVPCR